MTPDDEREASHDDDDLLPDDSWRSTRRRRTLLIRTCRPVMDDPLNPERDPAPFAAVRP